MLKLFVSGIRSAVRNAVVGGFADGIQEVMKNFQSQATAPEVEQTKAMLLSYFPDLTDESEQSQEERLEEEPAKKRSRKASS